MGGMEEVARGYDLSGEEVQSVHDEYLRQLIGAAYADGHFSDAERQDVGRVARLLGIGDKRLAVMLAAPPAVSRPSQCALAGKTVCFTGELQRRYRGSPISRELAMQLSAERGLVLARSVTKKLDVLVVADGDTQSGKARKAREYGTRIMHESVFWTTLGIEVS